MKSGSTTTAARHLTPQAQRCPLLRCGRCAGAAGSAAVATLLAHGFAGRLVWIDQERQPAYDRTALSKFVIAGQMPPDEVPALLEADALRKGQLERKHGKVRT